ncbi:MAG: hypothetical protein ACLT1J_00965 [Mediterraneibacter gnavus]
MVLHRTKNGVSNTKKRVVPLPQRKMLLCKLIDHAIEETDDFASFVAYLRKDGMQVNVEEAFISAIRRDGFSYAFPEDLGRIIQLTGSAEG